MILPTATRKKLHVEIQISKLGKDFICTALYADGGGSIRSVAWWRWSGGGVASEGGGVEEVVVAGAVVWRAAASSSSVPGSLVLEWGAFAVA